MFLRQKERTTMDFPPWRNQCPSIASGLGALVFVRTFQGIHSCAAQES